ncbi:MAG: hypothetical protein LBL31_00555 [Spirochaetaceae bacterium]|jgi:hypothetical protein|nr:hypothetical protein [Spirochaetaceae bacterium]
MMMKNVKLMILAGFVFAAAVSLSAQDYWLTSPGSPLEANLFNPESGLYRASMGTIRSDIDSFMDVGAFRDTAFPKMITYVGFDPQGITLGVGMKLGHFYFGVAYGGSLIQDLFSRATNQDPSELNLKLNSSGDSLTEVPGVFDSVGGKPAEAKNRNEFNIFLGLWRIGMKIGFSQMLTVAQPQGDEAVMEVGKAGQGFTFENAMVPSFALGASIPIKNSLFIIPEVSAQMDIHQFVNGSDPHTTIINGIAVPDFYSGYTQVFNEAKIGADLGIAYRNPGSEIRLGGGYYLKKRLTGFDIESGAEITHIVVNNNAAETIISTYDNLEQQIVPYILYSGVMGERGKIGVKLLADIRFNEYFLTPDSNVQAYGDYETHAKEIHVKPELDFGGTFALLPDRFSLHAGFGLNLYTFNISDSENKSLGQDNSSIQETLPSTRFAVGFTVNLDTNTTIDMLLITSGKFDFKNDPDYSDISALRRSAQDNNKFTLSLTIKR